MTQQNSRREFITKMSVTAPLEDLQEDLKCPVCWKMPRSIPVYQCMSGHIFCKECKPRLQTCPVCRIPLRSNQTRWALMTEKLLMKFPFKCHYAENGCQEPNCLLSDLEKHEKECKFRLVSCPINLLNYPNTGCKEQLPIGKITQHLKDKHE